jgi:acetylornithine deacetylase/succinyl-diaminopimelate desuccinylase-like protein
LLSASTFNLLMNLYQKALDLLTKLIAVPSFSREEEGTASLIQSFFENEGVEVQRLGNNIVVRNKHFTPDKPSVLLNSHHDTVRPNSGYTRDPFKPEIIDGRLFGLGSNDAGGPLASLIATFLHFYDRLDLRYNVVLAATAEEEISGTGGIEQIWESIAPIDFAVVGEPTLCEMATAEKGLMVLDCIARGKSGHAAREEGVNAIYAALPDIEWFRNYSFPTRSETLGDMKMTVTIINSGSQHNVVPAECKFTVDVRVTDKYTLEEALEIINKHVKCEVTPRSLRIRSSGIAMDHPLVLSAKKMGLRLYGSPTTSDQALIPAPSVKIGPGDSARSHSADEFIYLREIEKGINTYITLLSNVILL